MDHPAPGAASRRSFFRTSALAAVPASLLTFGAARAARNGSGISIPDLYPSWSARNFAEIRADENAHATYLEAVLGSNALPPASLNIQALTLPTDNPIVFPAYSSVFENTGAATYLNAAPLLNSKDYLLAAASIYGIECYHSGFINTLIDFPITLNGQSFLKPFTVEQTLFNVAPYFTDPGPVALLANSISTTPSDANDIKILNFALALERLEQAFYNINVPRFFGV